MEALEIWIASNNACVSITSRLTVLQKTLNATGCLEMPNVFLPKFSSKSNLFRLVYNLLQTFEFLLCAQCNVVRRRHLFLHHNYKD